MHAPAVVAAFAAASAAGLAAARATAQDAAIPQSGGYVVLAGCAPGDPFDAAAQALAKHHRAAIVRFDPADLAPVRKALAAAQPRHVALVLPPEAIHFAFVRRFLQLATELDDDPFVDFPFGYVTGRTGADALALAERGIAREPEPCDGGVAVVGGGAERSQVHEQPFLLRRQRLDGLQLYCAGETAFAEAGRDVAFLQAELPRLRGRDVVTFAGHGYPREVVGGPTFAHVAGLDLAGAVVLNVACYTGVTHHWLEADWRKGCVVARQVPLDESFCLAVLRTGVVGYTAYVCVRPAGPELDTDLAALVADGCSLGDARRRDYDKTVLGFLGFGEERLRLAAVADGDALAPNADPIRGVMLEGATGGVVFGDPACVPFAARAGEAPVAIEIVPEDGALRLKARVSAQNLFSHCSDQTAGWGKDMAMRVHARVPLGERFVTDVVVDSLKVGGIAEPSRVLWAVEHDQGERFVQLKVMFPRPEGAGSLALTARVCTTTDAALGRARGGDVRRPLVRSADVCSRTIEPFVLERATERGVSRELLQEALDASAAIYAGEPVPGVPSGALDKLVARGTDGFRAVCVLCEVGHTHSTTWQLLRDTWRPGAEQHLLALASLPELPAWSMWAVLEGLACADTPAVRTFLLGRLARETDAGLFMSAAAGLAHLGVRDAVAPIAARVLEFREGWSGVELHLVSALSEIGGSDAIAALERIGTDERCAQLDGVLFLLGRLDAAAAQRVRTSRGR